MGKSTRVVNNVVFHACPSCGRTDVQHVATHLFDSLTASAIEAMYCGGKSQYTIRNDGLEKEVMCDDCQNNSWDSYLSSDHYRKTCELVAASEQ